MFLKFSKALVPAVACSILLSACFCSDVSAQKQKQDQFRPAHLGIIYPVSTNGRQAADFVNGFSFHLLSGVSKAEQAFCLSGITSIVKQNANGLMLSGISNHAGGTVKGMQLAGILNIAGAELTGLQLAGIINLADDKMEGMQLAGLANRAGTVSGVQLAGIVNKASNANVQVSGLVNVAHRVKGVQIAGLLNIADESAYPIGLINIIKNGEQQIGLSLDESGSTVLAFRSGGRVLYGIVGVGYNFKYLDARYVAEVGLGAHIALMQHLRLNAEIAYTTLSDLQNDVFFKTTIRPLLAYKVTNRVELFAGPALNFSAWETVTAFSESGGLNRLYWGGMGGIQFNL